jgi:hypothetical protein
MAGNGSYVTSGACSENHQKILIFTLKSLEVRKKEGRGKK